ncbi:MAG TPA: hypothetical protein DDW49_05345 [Deltaproteobacteria bacterium]|nr:MAG: hypothetical protein A2048_04325 [Deltaproteobacteria bacterium GWA2_45_12]HBF12801.1 hypothetical protein [Deltaproteobacteria bacterium]
MANRILTFDGRGFILPSAPLRSTPEDKLITQIISTEAGKDHYLTIDELGKLASPDTPKGISWPACRAFFKASFEHANQTGSLHKLLDGDEIKTLESMKDSGEMEEILQLLPLPFLQKMYEATVEGRLKIGIVNQLWASDDKAYIPFFRTLVLNSESKQIKAMALGALTYYEDPWLVSYFEGDWQRNKHFSDSAENALAILSYRNARAYDLLVKVVVSDPDNYLAIIGLGKSYRKEAAFVLEGLYCKPNRHFHFINQALTNMVAKGVVTAGELLHKAKSETIKGQLNILTLLMEGDFLGPDDAPEVQRIMTLASSDGTAEEKRLADQLRQKYIDGLNPTQAASSASTFDKEISPEALKDFLGGRLFGDSVNSTGGKVSNFLWNARNKEILRKGVLSLTPEAMAAWEDRLAQWVEHPSTDEYQNYHQLSMGFYILSWTRDPEISGRAIDLLEKTSNPLGDLFNEDDLKRLIQNNSQAFIKIFPSIHNDDIRKSLRRTLTGQRNSEFISLIQNEWRRESNPEIKDEWGRALVLRGDQEAIEYYKGNADQGIHATHLARIGYHSEIDRHHQIPLNIENLHAQRDPATQQPILVL